MANKWLSISFRGLALHILHHGLSSKARSQTYPYMKTWTWWNYFIEKSYWGWCRVHPSRWLSLAFEPGVGQLFYSCASNGEFFYFRSTLWQLDISVNRVKGGLIQIVQKVWIRVQLWRWFLQDRTTETHYLRSGLSVWSSRQTRNVRCCEGRPQVDISSRSVLTNFADWRCIWY